MLWGDTLMDDKDFQAFCSELRKETPDMSVILDGVEKYGTGALSDTQRAEFLKKMFPPKSISNKDRGFQDTTGIRNALKAMQQLQADGKIGAEQMKAFLLETNPKGGANVVTTLALNVKAAEMKLRATYKGKPAIGKPEIRSALQQNLQAMTETLGILAEVDGAVLQDVLQAPDKTSKQGSFKDYAKKSAILSEFKPKAQNVAAPNRATGRKDTSVANNASSAPETTDESDKLTFEAMPEEAPIRLGGMEEDKTKTLNISAKPKDLNVQAKPTPEEEENKEEKKVAKLQDAKGDSTDGKDSFDFEPVKEQDIIQYMYNAWFLGSINGIMKWAFKKADRGIDRLINRFDALPSASATATNQVSTQAPQAALPATAGNTAPQPQERTQGDTATSDSFLRQIDRLAKTASNYYLDHLHIGSLGADAASQKYINSLITDIQINLHKKPEEWNAKVLVASTDAPFMEQMAQIYDANPKEFTTNLQTLAQNPQVLDAEYMTKLLMLSAHLAAIDYAVRNPEKELVGNAEANKFVIRKTFEKMVDIQKSAQVLQNQAEVDFRHEKGIAPDAPIPSRDKVKIEQKVGEEFGGYYFKLTNDSADLEELMNRRHQEANPKQKKILDRDIQQKHQELTALQGVYLPGKDERAPTLELPTRPKDTDKKMDIKEAAHADAQSQKTEKQWMGSIEANREQLAAKTAEHGKRHEAFNRGKEAVLNSSTRLRQMGKIAKRNRSEKGEYS